LHRGRGMLNVREEDIDKITEAFHLILKGKIPAPIELPKDYPRNEIRQVVDYVNRFIAEYRTFADILSALSKGELDFDPPKGEMHVLQSFKNLHANLRHLTWKTQQIAKGDFTQKVDFMGNFSTAFNSMTQLLQSAFMKIELQNQELSEANVIIQNEKQKSDQLLLNILPERVAEDLKQTGKTIPEHFDDVTVLFSDIVGFTEMSSKLSPQTLINELNDLFTQYDAFADQNHCERIKTIGDAYLAVCGMPVPNPHHAANIVRTATQMIGFLESRNANTPLKWRIRIGVHSGPVVGAVVGVKKYIYDVFGDTINTASRMESNSEPMRINVSEATFARAKDEFHFIPRPPVEVKSKGLMRMYFLAPDQKT
jgi:class 3 adenylate cyclase